MNIESARQMMQCFEGSDLAHGRADITGNKTKSGKYEAICRTEKRPVSEEDWIRHLKGEAGIGIPPINSSSMVKWGAIDVDQYRGLSLEDLCADITARELPLVVCRSKSGGPHIYLFVQDWVPASEMVEKLDALAGILGFGTSEIFPKQVTIGQGDTVDYGNWINMPYFNGAEGMRYGMDSLGDALESVEDFLSFVATRRLTVEQFESFEPVAKDSGDSFFHDGPPCLNNIFAKGKALEGSRNVILCNVAVYLKKAYPDDWAKHLDEVNNQMPDPLPSAEVQNIIKSYNKKDYKYQCSKSPLCDFCNSQICRTRAHGVGEQNSFLPNNRSLTKINTSPPIWYLDVVGNREKVVRMSLNTEELQNPRLFQKRAMETLNVMPPVPKQDDWREMVTHLMEHLTVIDMPPELTPRGQFLELLEDFLLERAKTDDIDVILRGLVYSAASHYFFRWSDFKDYLETHRFNLLKQNEMLAVIKNELQGVKKKDRIAGRSINFFELPKEHFAEVQTEKLTESVPTDPF